MAKRQVEHMYTRETAVMSLCCAINTRSCREIAVSKSPSHTHGKLQCAIHDDDASSVHIGCAKARHHSTAAAQGDCPYNTVLSEKSRN